MFQPPLPDLTRPDGPAPLAPRRGPGPRTQVTATAARGFPPETVQLVGRVVSELGAGSSGQQAGGSAIAAALGARALAAAARQELGAAANTSLEADAASLGQLREWMEWEQRPPQPLAQAGGPSSPGGAGGASGSPAAAAAAAAEAAGLPLLSTKDQAAAAQAGSVEGAEGHAAVGDEPGPEAHAEAQAAPPAPPSPPEGVSTIAGGERLATILQFRMAKKALLQALARAGG